MEAGMCNSEFRTPLAEAAERGCRCPSGRTPQQAPNSAAPLGVFETGALVLPFARFIPLLLLASAAYATSPKLTSITPTGAQRGTEVELKLAGSRLDDAQELVFYEPGISVLKLDSSKTNVVKAQIKIAP